MTGNKICSNRALDWPSAAANFRGPHPAAYDVLIPWAVAAFLCTLVITLINFGRIWHFKKQVVSCYFSFLTVFVAGLPLWEATCQLISVLSPRASKGIDIVLAFLESISFWFLRQLYLKYSEAGSGRPIDENISQLKPTKIWPWQRCGCVAVSSFSSTDLRITLVAVVQFMIIAPVTSFIELSPAVHENQKVGTLLLIIDLVSLVTVVLGTVDLVNGLHELFQENYAHSKLWFLKSCFIGGTIVKRVANMRVTDDELLGDYCYPATAIASAWAGAITNTICVILSLWGLFIFRAGDFNSSQHTSASPSSILDAELANTCYGKGHEVEKDSAGIQMKNTE